MGADLKITPEHVQGRENVMVLHLGGWLDALGEKQFLAAIQNAKDQGADRILLELSEMDTITSAGIRAMQQAYQILTPKDAALKNSRLKLCNAPPQIYHVLASIGFLMDVPMYESMDDGIDSFGK
jgi:anti-anti-sigma factor